MGDIVFGDKNIFGDNSRMINIQMKNYFGSDSNKDEEVQDSNIVNAEDAEIVEEVKSSSKRGRPRKTGKAIQKSFVSFVYRALTDADTNQRLQFLYNGLKQLQWIAANTLQKNFLKRHVVPCGMDGRYQHAG